jgi:hypothetical protein
MLQITRTMVGNNEDERVLFGTCTDTMKTGAGYTEVSMNFVEINKGRVNLYLEAGINSRIGVNGTNRITGEALSNDEAAKLFTKVASAKTYEEAYNNFLTYYVNKDMSEYLA